MKFQKEEICKTFNLASFFNMSLIVLSSIMWTSRWIQRGAGKGLDRPLVKLEKFHFDPSQNLIIEFGSLTQSFFGYTSPHPITNDNL